MARDERPMDETGDLVARIRQTSWRGWIWAVPLAALILGGYLVVKTFLLAGPTVTVTFPAADGVTGGGQTPVHYRGVKVGSVSKVQLNDSLDGVVMQLSLERRLSDALRSGTKFWIARPSVLSGDLSGLLSGAHIAMEPGGGEPTHTFTGLTEPPVEEPYVPGTTYVVQARSSGGLQQGAVVTYDGMQAGHVLGVSLADGGPGVRIRVLVRSPYDRMVRRDTRFWRCGGLSLSTGASGVEFSLPPIQRLLEGCLAFGSFGAGTAPPAPADHAFRLYGSESAAATPFTGAPVLVGAEFPGSVSGLQPGATVELAGVPVGEVRDISLVVTPAGQVSTPVTFDLYPERFGLPTEQLGASAGGLYDLLGRLVRRGLRAQLVSGSLVLGGKKIALVMTSRRSASGLDRSTQPPEIPAIGGGSIQSVVASAGRAADAIAAIPFQPIGQDLRRVTDQLATIARSGRLQQSVARLDSALTNVEALTGQAREQVGPALTKLNQAVGELQSAMTAVSNVTGGSYRDQQDLGDLVAELTRAARSLRMLTDYLDRHPEALLRGRGGP